MNQSKSNPAGDVTLEATLSQASGLIQANRFDSAIRLLNDYLRDYPDEVAALHMLGIGQRKAGRIDEALKTQQSVLKQDPGFAAAHQESGLCHRLAGRRTDAMEAFRRATQTDPRLVNSWKFLGDMAVQLGDEATAIEAYGKFPAETEDDPMLARALELIEGNKLGLADIVIRQYLKRNPRDARALYHQSRIAVGVGAITEALQLLESALAIAPSDRAARYDYVHLLSRRQRYEEALAEIDRLLRAEPENHSYRLLKAALLDRSGQFEQSADILKQLLRENPQQPKVWTGLANVQRTQGKQAEAISSLHKAIDHDPYHSEAWYQLADMKVYRFTDGQVEALRRAVDHAPKGSGEEINLCFALARALEGRGEAGEAFEFYARGNNARNRSAQFSPEEHMRFVAAVKNTCTPELVRELEGVGCPDDAPIFIVGLPRAGTTLVEQIVTAHSQVDGVMELAHIATLVKELNFRQQKRNRPTYPQALAAIDDDEFREIGEAYIERSRILRGSAPHFVDKMPNNFEHVGLIRLALPNARIIDVRREPMANGWSAYRHLFRSGQEWSYDFENIAFYYLAYQELMAFWDGLFPGKIHRVQYERLVQQPEAVTRELLAFLKLPFEAACLAPERNTRAVRTASSEQVRQGIHTEAVEQWRTFETQLEPLKQALGEG